MLDDERTAAILNGKQRSGSEKQFSYGFPSEDAASNPASPRVVDHHHHDGRSSTQVKEQNNKDRRRANPKVQNNKGTYRIRIKQPSNARSAGRQRINHPELQDEAFVRRTMHVPTSEDYPYAPRNAFKNPRRFIFDLAHGQQLAECRSEFTSLGKGAQQCTAYYDSAMHTEVVIGEGRTNAGRSVS